MLTPLLNELVNSCKRNGFNEDQTVILALMTSQYGLEDKMNGYLKDSPSFTWDEIINHFAGFLRDPKNADIKVPNRSKEELADDTKEYEAEMVCQSFCKVLGYEYDSSAYLRYYDEALYKDQFSLRYVMEAADKMIANW